MWGPRGTLLQQEVTTKLLPCLQQVCTRSVQYLPGGLCHHAEWQRCHTAGSHVQFLQSLSLFFFFSLIGIDFDSQVTQAITGELRVELAEESLSKHLTFKEVFISGKKISDFIFVQAAQHLLKG